MERVNCIAVVVATVLFRRCAYLWRMFVSRTCVRERHVQSHIKCRGDASTLKHCHSIMKDSADLYVICLMRVAADTPCNDNKIRRWEIPTNGISA